MSRELSRAGRLLALLVLVAVALPAAAIARSSGESAARAAVIALRSRVAHAGLPGATRRQLSRELRAGTGSLRSSTRACAAIGAVELVRLATLTRRHSRRVLLPYVTRAERALQRLKATRACAPRVHTVHLELIHPRYVANGPRGPTVHEQGGEEAYSVPIGPHFKPTGPEGAPTDIPASSAPAARAVVAAVPATVSGPLQIQASSDLGVLGDAYPQEPQVAQAGGVVLYSGNLNGAVSFDGGSSFTELDPSRVFGNDQPLCCDTVIRYAPSIDRFVWIMQYWCPPEMMNGQTVTDCHATRGFDNRYRIATISPAQLLANRAAPTTGWTVHQLTATDLRARDWLDYPDASVGSSHLYMTCDVVGVGNLAIRIPLRQLAGSRTVSAQYEPTSDIFWRTAENSGNVGIFLANANSSQDQAFLWPDLLPFGLHIRLDHATRPDDSFSVLRPGGTQNWNDRAGSPVVKGATVASGQLWLAWAAGRTYRPGFTGPSWPQPHIQLAVYNLADLYTRLATTLSPTAENYIWSSTTAYSDPILATNAEGEVGITFVGADAHSMPAPYVGVLTNHNSILRAAVSQGPTNAVEGDYAGLTIDYDNPNSWIAANSYTTTNAEGGLGVHWLYTRFGRGSTIVPPPPTVLTPTSIKIDSVTGSQYSCCFYGDLLHTYGTLSGAPAGATVGLEYTSPDEVTGIAHFVTTDASGHFSDTWVPPARTKAEVWTIVAHYYGDAHHNPSDSDPYYQTVQPPPS